MRIWPCSGVAVPPSRPSRVDFPLPLGPSRNTRSPSATVNSAISMTGGSSGSQRKRTSESEIILGAGTRSESWDALSTGPKISTGCWMPSAWQHPAHQRKSSG